MAKTVVLCPVGPVITYENGETPPVVLENILPLLIAQFCGVVVNVTSNRD